MQGRQYRCGLCGRYFLGRAALHTHRVREHRLQYGGGDMQESPFAQNERPFEQFPDAEKMHQLYKDNEVYILRPHMLENPNVQVFNYPIKGKVTDAELERQMRDIYENPDTGHAYKLELTAGVILRGTDDGELRYYKPETNSYVLDVPMVIDSPAALEANIEYLQQLDVDDLIRSFRPNTKFVVQYIVQLEWHLWPMDYPLGRNEQVELPQYIIANRSIITGFDYAGYENCCLFVALSQHISPQARHPHHKTAVNALLMQWFRYCHAHKVNAGPFCGPQHFKGVEWNHLWHFEQCFDTNLCIMEYLPGKSAVTHYSKQNRFSDTLYLNQYNHHLSYISCIQSYSQRFKCDHCQRLFKKHHLMAKHRNTCGKKSRYVYPASAYIYHKSVFEKLEEVGVLVPAQDRFYPYVACFDLESALMPCENPPTSIAAKKKAQNADINKQGTVYNKVHHPISCSVASNVDGHTEPVCFVEENPDILVGKMFDKFAAIRQSAVEIARAKWGGCLIQLEQKLEGRRAILRQIFEHRFTFTRAGANTAVNLECDNDDRSLQLKKFLKADPMFNSLQQLYREFYLYIHRTIICSFNGAKYDVPLLKGPLIKYMLDHEDSRDEDGGHYQEFDAEREFELMFGEGDADPDGADGESEGVCIESLIEEMKLGCMGKLKVIKRGNAYVSLSNNCYTFLDIINYLPVGCNYKKFLKAYNAEGDTKGYWCYEYIDSFQKLSMPLPPYPSAAWISELKGGIDLLHEDYAEWERNGGLGEAPLKGKEVYAEIQKEWETEGFTCLRQMLISYNNKDTLPMISAIQTMQKEYFALGLDLFKISVSAPGLSRVLMMRHAQRQQILFPLFSKEDSDCYWWFKGHIAAGAALTFDRFCQVGHTYLRPDKKYKCMGVEGYDMNGLYCGLFQGPMPTSMYVRRYANDGYVPHYRAQLYAQYVWLQYMAESLNVYVKSRLNQGSDIRVGPYFVDGMYVGATGQITILEYLGCYYHKCIKTTCRVSKGGTVGIEGAYERWVEKKNYLLNRGYSVTYIWECEMEKLMQTAPYLKQRLEAMKPAFLKRHLKGVSMSDIIEGIRDGTFYGFLEASLHVPPERYAEFIDFPPLFCNHTVKVADVGPVMQQYIKDNNIKAKERRLLISGLAANKMLLNSRLAAYYLSLGLVITEISQILEFVPQLCFESFVKEVTSKRQEAALNPDRKVIGELYKLLGIYIYWLFFMLAKTIHSNVLYFIVHM